MKQRRRKDVESRRPEIVAALEATRQRLREHRRAEGLARDWDQLWIGLQLEQDEYRRQLQSEFSELKMTLEREKKEWWALYEIKHRDMPHHAEAGSW